MTKALMDSGLLSKSELRIIENKKRRMRIVRRQKMALVFFATVIFFLVFFLRNTLQLEAQNENLVPKCKYYKVVTVHAGDNLSKIADMYFDEEEYENVDSYVDEICSINGLSDENLINAGENLVVPYYDVFK